MKRTHEEETVKESNQLVLPSPHDHYIMWLTLMICPEWPREIVTHEIMPRFCSQENIMYSYIEVDKSGFFRHRRPCHTWSLFNVYYTPLTELHDKMTGFTLCDEAVRSMHININSDTMTVNIRDSTENDKVYEITRETTYYTLIRSIDTISACVI